MSRRTLEIARALAAPILVLGVAAAALAAVDAVPGCLAGEPRGVRRLRSIDEAERRLRARLVLPAYFPDTLRWPPVTIRIATGSPSSVALAFAPRSGEGEVLLVAQTIGGVGTISPALLDPGSVLDSSRVAIRGVEGNLARVIAEGQVWNEVRWDEAGRTVALRGKTSVDDLVRMARSAHREGPP